MINLGEFFNKVFPCLLRSFSLHTTLISRYFGFKWIFYHKQKVCVVCAYLPACSVRKRMKLHGGRLNDWMTEWSRQSCCLVSCYFQTFSESDNRIPQSQFLHHSPHIAVASSPSLYFLLNNGLQPATGRSYSGYINRETRNVVGIRRCVRSSLHLFCLFLWSQRFLHTHHPG